MAYPPNSNPQKRTPTSKYSSHISMNICLILSKTKCGLIHHKRRINPRFHSSKGPKSNPLTFNACKTYSATCYPNTHKISSRMHLGNSLAQKCSQPVAFPLCMASNYLLFRSKPLFSILSEAIFFKNSLHSIEYAISSLLSITLHDYIGRWLLFTPFQ